MTEAPAKLVVFFCGVQNFQEYLFEGCFALSHLHDERFLHDPF
jgi:hypothetical protein